MSSPASQDCDNGPAANTCPPLKKRQFNYGSVSDDIRKELVKRVIENREKIVKAAQALGINYSTAKSIITVYRTENRFEKIPQKLRKRKAIKDKAIKKKVTLNKSQVKGLQNSEESKSEDHKSKTLESNPASEGSDTAQFVKVEAKEDEEEKKEHMKVEEPISHGGSVPTLGQLAEYHKSTVSSLSKFENALRFQEYLLWQDLVMKSSILRASQALIPTQLGLFQSRDFLIPGASRYPFSF